MTRDDERPELPNPMVCSVLMISYLILDFLTPHDFLRYFSTSVKTVLIETLNEREQGITHTIKDFIEGDASAFERPRFFQILEIR